MWGGRGDSEKDREAVRRRLARMWGQPNEPAGSASYGLGQPDSGWPPEDGAVVDRLFTRDATGVAGPASPRGRHSRDGDVPTTDRDAPARLFDFRAGPQSWLASMADPGRRGLRAMVAAGALIALAAALWAWHARPTATPLPPVPAVLASSAPASSASVATIVVAVTGKVAHPGLVTLPAGARVADAIAAAGGVLPGTDITTLNLARKLTDGELIAVGVPMPDVGGGAAPAGPINLNTATLAQLDTLPGVGPTLAQRIIDYRQAHGGFKSVGELQQVAGIGDSKYAELKDLVTV